MMNPTDLPGDSLLNLLLSAIVGACFGLVLGKQAVTAGQGLVWGIVLSVVWWWLGPLTLFPLSHGERPTWDLATAQTAFPLFIGLAVTYGAFLGVLYWLFCTVVENRYHLQRLRQHVWHFLQVAITGGLAGLLGGWVFGAWMEQAGFFPLIAGLVNAADLDTGRGLHFLISIIIGISYGVLFVQDTRTFGASIAWGMIYGFMWWVLGALTLMPWLLGAGIQWGLAPAQAAFPSLLGHLLYGITLGIVQSGLVYIWRVLFIDSDPLTREPEGPGTRNLRALGLGAIASLGGGLIFSGVMIATNALPVVAALAGMSSPLVGFFVHMAISSIIGATYGILFRAEIATRHTALGWGMVYGVMWWLLGPLTLMPLLLGSPLQWSLESASNNFPSLIGHLLYGVVLALLYSGLSQRYLPHAKNRQQPTTQATPALWLLIILFLFFMLLLLG
jgi:uncharacterized membrane protein YagU involved in acid resistance